MSEELEKKQDNRETKIGNREELFEQILAISDRKLILHCARIVFECSVEDGLTLMEKLKLGNQELVKIIASPSFIIKHREVFSGVAGKISPKKAQQKISANSDKKALADLIIDRDKQLKIAEKAEDWEEFTEELEAERDRLPQTEVIKKITDYYAPFLKTRKFAPKDVTPNKNYPRGEEVTGLGGETRRLRSSEQVADEALSQYALMLNGAHYIASVKNILNKYLKENNLSGEPNFSSDELFVTKDVIEKECARLSIPFTGVESRLKTARYSSFSAGVGRVEAEKGILKKLNEALKEKGKKAELVGDKYEIVDDEKAEKETKEFDFAKFEEKALDYIEKLLEEGTNKKFLAQCLSGLDSERAWLMREKLLEEGVVRDFVVAGLSGLDSERAWTMRERLLKECVDIGNMALGLAGLDSDRAWTMRERLLNDGADKGSVALGLSGLDSDRAWLMRKRLLEEGADKSLVVVGLSGLDSERAWTMREILIIDGSNKDWVALGLAGLDSERAWTMRKRLLEEGTNKNYVARGLAGLDSDHAWTMRERLLNDGADKSSVAMGLAGLDSERAWTMRERLLNDGAGKSSVAMGLAGDNTTFVWQLKLKEKKQQQELLSEDAKKLALINLLHKPNIEGISRHFGGTKDEVEEMLKRKRESGRSLAESFKFTNFLNKLINRDPQLFLNDMSAKKDRLTNLFVERLADRIFPETKERKGNWRGFSGYSGIESSKSINSSSPENCLQPGFGNEFSGSGAEELNDNREIMEFRDPLNGIVVTGIYGDYNANSKNWSKIEFPLDTPITEPVKEITATIPNVKNLKQIILPKPLEAKIIPERVKGFDAGGKEFDLQVEINKLGGVMVINKPKQVEKIAYSISVSTLPPPLEDLSQKDYNLYRQHLEVSNGRELTNSISTLPEDLELQLAEAIKNKSPKEQVIAIERLVRDLGYYDVNNQEVNQLKNGKSLEEQLYIMEQRLEELRQNNSDSDEYKGKRFVGVCADFAKITAMLLRRAGFASGMISGFGGQEKVVRVKHAHATAFVLWPDAEGRNRVISIDGTPDGLVGISTLSLVEKEVEAIKNERELSVEAIKEVEQIIKDLNNLDVESVRRMSNGELERVLNNILKYQVKESHLAIIERLLEYYWYTPVHELDLDNPYQQSEAVLELASAVERQRKRLIAQPEQDQTPAGNKLMQTMQEFLRRFETAGATEDKDSGLSLMEKIVELVQNDLSDLEKKSAYAVIAYLKAKNILGDKS